MENPLLDYALQRAGISKEEYQRIVENYRNNSTAKRDFETIGNALVVTFQNDNQLGDLVMSLFIQVNDMAMMVMELEQRVSSLEGSNV
jgi:hypothetical protein